MLDTLRLSHGDPGCLAAEHGAQATQVCVQRPARGGGRIQPQWDPAGKAAAGSARPGAPRPGSRAGGGAGRGRWGVLAAEPQVPAPGSRPRGSSGARRRGRPEAMAAHGKLRRERGLQAEYEAQVKGERASGAPGSVPRREPKVVGEPENSLRWPRARCSSLPAPPPPPRDLWRGLRERGREGASPSPLPRPGALCPPSPRPFGLNRVLFPLSSSLLSFGCSALFGSPCTSPKSPSERKGYPVPPRKWHSSQSEIEHLDFAKKVQVRDSECPRCLD